MSIISLIVLVVVAGLIAWIISMMPIPQPYARIAQTLILVAVLLYAVIWLLRLGGIA